MVQNNDAQSTRTRGWKRYPLPIRKQLYLNPEQSKVKFLFPNSIEWIPVHKRILKRESEVFRKLFKTDWKRKREILMEDSTPEAFKEFLRFLYLGSGAFTKQNIERVMYLAKKYDVKDCLLACTQFLKDSITLDDVCSGYAASILYEQADLKAFCEDKIKTNATKVFSSANFLDCNQDTLLEILKLDLLCRETTIFDSCIKWAKKRCVRSGLDGNSTNNLRAQLGECLRCIRFGSMDEVQFRQRNLKYPELLDSQELEEAKNCMQRPRYSYDKSKSWKCEPHYARTTLICSTENVTMWSNKTTLLGGVWVPKLLGKYPNSIDETSATIKIIEKSSASEEVLSPENVSIEFSHRDEKYIKFAKPIIINESMKYEIRIEFKGCFPVYVMHTGKIESPNGLEIIFEAEGNFHLIAGLDLLDV